MATPTIWIGAARLRTLPLAFASILLGTWLAAAQGSSSWGILSLTLLTTLCLQILSNYANDLGDTLHGADHKDRKGPMRAVQTGTVSAGQMRKAVIIMSVASLASGVALLALAIHSVAQLLGFLGLGLGCIAAAILYTNGKRPYGYAGLGDISVLIFFGLVGVLGTYLLYGLPIHFRLFLPAISAGLLATGVLNVNNLRDIQSDKAAGKLSIPVRLGFARGKRYHLLLIGGAILCAVAYVAGLGLTSPYAWLFAGPAILLLGHARTIYQLPEPHLADPYLKQLALLSLLFDFVLGVGMYLAKVFPAGIGLY